MYYTKEYLKRAHREIDTIFRVLFPEHGMAVREEQIMLCHEMLDNLLGRNIALCDAGVGIGKTYANKIWCGNSYNCWDCTLCGNVNVSKDFWHSYVDTRIFCIDCGCKYRVRKYRATKYLVWYNHIVFLTFDEEKNK